MKKFNFFEKLWEHGRTLRRVGLVLVMCLITITQAWAGTATFTCGTTSGYLQWSSGKTASQEKAPITINLNDCGNTISSRPVWYSGNTAQNENAFQLSSAAGNDPSSNYIEISAASGYKITGVTMRGCYSGSATSQTYAAFFWSGSYSTGTGDVIGTGTITFPGKPSTSDAANVNMSTITNGTRTIRVYKQVKYNSSTQTIGNVSGSASTPSTNPQSVNIAQIVVTYEATASDGWYLYGTFGDGSTWADTWIADNSTQTGYVDLELAENTTYSFTIKHITGGNTYWSRNNGTYTRYHNNEEWEFNHANNPNTSLRTDIAGTYRLSFRYHASTPKLTVTYPTGVLVTLDYNHSSLSEPWQAISGEPMPTPPTPSRTDYAFVGWYTTSSCTTPFNFDAPITSATTIYAKWDPAWKFVGSLNWSNYITMTRSSNQMYWYYTCTGGSGYEFILYCGSTPYYRQNIQRGFNGTDITDPGQINDGDNASWNVGNNCATYRASGTYYIIVYPANTPANSTGSPVICASTFLPNDESFYSFYGGTHKIFFDNSSSKWSNIHFRVGRTNHNSAFAMTKVKGTDSLYMCTSNAYSNYFAYHVANQCAWTGNERSIYTLRPGSYDIDSCLVFQKKHIFEDITLTPGDKNNEDGGVNYYKVTQTIGMKKDRVTISPYENGTITVNYRDTSNTAQTLTSGSADLAHTVILTSITAVPTAGYEIDGALTINGDDYAANYVVTGPTTVAASFKGIVPDAPSAAKITATDGCSAGATFSADISGLPSYVTWYWQTSSDGTSTDYPASSDYTTNSTAGSKTIYLRAKNTAAGLWSTSSASKSATVRTAATISWNNAPADGVMGGSMTASVTTNYSDGVAYSVTSASPSGCVTINGSTGAISYVAGGTATIRATVTGAGDYCSSAYVEKSITSKVSVTYAKNNNSATGSQSDGSSPYTKNSRVTVKDQGTMALSNYQFVGWNTAANGSGTWYSPGANFAITANTTLNAQWRSTSGTTCPSTAGGTVFSLSMGDNSEGSKKSLSFGETFNVGGQSYVTVTNGAAHLTDTRTSNSPSGTKATVDKTNPAKIEFGGNDVMMTLYLDCPLEVGDVIAYTGDDDQLAFSILPSRGSEEENIIASTTSQSYTVEDNDLVGPHIIYVWRKNGAGTTYMTALTITRPADSHTISSAVSPSGYGSVSNGSAGTSITVADGSTISISENVLTCDEKTLTATPTSDGVYYTYSFSSWSGTGVSDGATVSGDLTATANFTRTAVNYSLAWDKNGSGDALSGTYDSGTTAYGSSITKPNDPTWVGHTFSKWNSADNGTGDDYTGSMPAANTTYYAQWTANKYDVAFTLSNAAYSSGTDEGDEVATCGTDYEVVFAATSGYVFPSDITVTIGASSTTKGTQYAWDASTGALTVYGSYIVGNIAISITAEEEVTTYSVTYDGDEPTSGSAPSGGSDYEGGETIVVADDNGMSKDDYTFRGWSDGTMFFLPGQSFTMPTSNVTLTAVWESTSEGGGCYEWEGDPASYTEGSFIADENLVVEADPSDAGTTAIGTARISTNPSNRDVTCITINSSDHYITGYLSDGAEITSLSVGASTNHASNEGLIVAVFCADEDFSSGVTVETATAHCRGTEYSDATFIQKFTPASGTKYFRIYRKINGGVKIGDYTAPKDGVGSQTLQVFYISACSESGGSDSNFDVTFANGSNVDPAPSTYHWTELPDEIIGVPDGDKIVEPETEPEAVGYDFGGWYKEAACTNAWTFTSDAVTSDKTLYAKWTTNVRHFIGGVSGHEDEWGQTGNWEEGELPNRNSIVYITAPLKIVHGETPRHVGRVIIVTGGDYTPDGGEERTCTGKIDIEYNAALIVKTYVKRCADAANIADPSKYEPTAEADLHIGASPYAANGALVMVEHDGTNNAVVDFAPLSGYQEKYEDLLNQFVGTPFNDHGAVIQDYYYCWLSSVSYTYSLDGSPKLEPNWEWMNSDDGMEPFWGYDLTSYNPANSVFNMTGTLVETDNQDLPLYNRHTLSGYMENLLANSWTAPIQISAFKASDFVNADAVIYIFNSAKTDDIIGDPTEGSGEDCPGTYTCLPINLAGNRTIPSMQSFSVLATSTPAEGEASVYLDYKRLVYDPAAEGIHLEQNHAPRRNEMVATESNDAPENMKLHVKGVSTYGDYLWMVVRDDFSEGKDNGWEARMLQGTGEAPQIYTIREIGNMSIDAVNDLEGTVLGFHKGTKDDTYTFHFEYDGWQTWYLNDLKEQKSTLIDSEETYMFTSAASDTEARFVISATPINAPAVVTDIDNVNDGTKARKMIINDKMYIIIDGKMYDATGKAVK